MIMNFDIAVLRSFALIAQGRTFAETADLVGRSPSAISLQIQRLESELGAPVFRRNSQGVELTMAGERLLGYANRLIQVNDEASLSVRSSEPQKIGFGVTQDFAEGALPQVLQHFALEHPDVDLTLRIDSSKALVEAVHREEIDVAIALARDDAVNQGVIADAPMIWIGRHGFRHNLDKPLPLALLEPPCSFRTAALDALGAIRRPYRIAASGPSLGGTVAAAKTGLGITVRTKHLLSPLLIDLGDELDLPQLSTMTFCLYSRLNERRPARDDLIALCRRYFHA
ncbi:MAG: LysR family transcriptional regulator [Rhizobiaceae bacterium]|nr:LysR family transcriptional regulator [Rhizobiaceae bacterium]